jgi:hypothetical protein
MIICHLGNTVEGMRRMPLRTCASARSPIILGINIRRRCLHCMQFCHLCARFDCLLGLVRRGGVFKDSGAAGISPLDPSLAPASHAGRALEPPALPPLARACLTVLVAPKGNVNRLKRMKRQMYGHVGLDLLRKGVIHHLPWVGHRIRWLSAPGR